MQAFLLVFRFFCVAAVAQLVEPSVVVRVVVGSSPIGRPTLRFCGASAYAEASADKSGQAVLHRVFSFEGNYDSIPSVFSRSDYARRVVSTRDELLACD